jgi:hypothetical protein
VSLWHSEQRHRRQVLQILRPRVVEEVRSILRRRKL